MSNSNRNRLVPGALVALLVLAAAIYFVTRPKEPPKLPSAAPSASAPPRVSAPARPTGTTAALPSATPPGNLEEIAVATLGPKGFAELAVLAKAKGYFEAEGLNVKIEHVKAGSDIVRDVSDKKYAFGITFDFSIAFTAFTNPGFVVLARLAHAERPMTIYARKDKRIATGADLKGKRIGIEEFPSSHYFLGRYLERQRLTEADVTVIEMQHEQLEGALIRGEIDALAEGIAALRGVGWPNLPKTPSLEVVTLSEPAICSIQLGLIAGDELVKKKPETAEHFTRAIAKAVAFIKEHQDDAIKEIAQGVPTQPDRARSLSGSLGYEIALDPALLATLESQGKWFEASGRNKKGGTAPSYAGLLYPEALRKALPGAVTLP